MPTETTITPTLVLERAERMLMEADQLLAPHGRPGLTGVTTVGRAAPVPLQPLGVQRVQTHRVRLLGGAVHQVPPGLAHQSQIRGGAADRGGRGVPGGDGLMADVRRTIRIEVPKGVTLRVEVPSDAHGGTSIVGLAAGDVIELVHNLWVDDDVVCTLWSIRGERVLHD